MTTSLMLADRTTGFKMRRATLLNGSFVTDLDPLVDQRIAELDALLGKHLFSPMIPDDGEVEAEADEAAANGRGEAQPQHVREARMLLSRPFLPWRPVAEIIKKPGWPANSLVDTLADAEDDEAGLSLSDHIDLVPELADLKYDFAARLEQGLLGLDANARAVLQGRFNIIDFLVARAYHLGGLRDPKALYNYIVGNREGVRAVVGYVAVSAARTLITKQKLRVPSYHDDVGAFTLRLKAKPISFSDAGFEKAVTAIANDLMYNADANRLLEKSKLGPVPELIKPALIQLIKGFKIPLTADNIDVFLPSLITQAYENEAEESLDEPLDSEAEDRGYQVQFRDAADPEIDINREAVHYAAQLFHAMVIGEELGVFDAFQYLLHSRMIVGGGMEVRDKRLRADLRLYTLSNQFRDLGRPGRPQEERTRPSERKMFARMVFAQGDGQLMEGMPENTEFRQLWEVLMLESARYLERAQESFNPGSFVSKQNVMQAVEDLQYNLSTHCVGWPQVMAPAIDAELNFVLARFVQNEKIAQQVLPAGGSWKRVIDKLNAERPKKRPVPAAALLYAKATQGMQILEAVADYSPAEFEDDRAFSGFISLVDAYITTESKLQSRGGPAYRAAAPDEDEEADEPARPYPAGDESTPAANDDEWDF